MGLPKRPHKFFAQPLFFFLQISNFSTFSLKNDNNVCEMVNVLPNPALSVHSASESSCCAQCPRRAFTAG